MRNYESELPAQYTEAAHIKFADVKTGFLYDLKAVLPGIVLAAIGCVVVKLNIIQVLLSLLIFALGIYPYFCLHELTHGFVYMAATRQNVKIRFTKGGAYCAMPDVFVYRRVGVVCTAAPLVVFSALLGGGALLLIMARNWLFLPLGILLVLHLLGCRSDVNLLREIGNFKDPKLLIRDNGAEQWLYVLSREAEMQ